MDVVRFLIRLSIIAAVSDEARKGRAALSLPSRDSSDRHGQAIHDELLFSPMKARIRRSTELPTFSSADSLYVELVLVADNSLYRKYDGDLLKVRSRLAEIVSVANALYWPLNISLALAGVEIWDEVDKISIVSDAQATLKNFLKYRREDLLLRLPNDCAYLITANSFYGDVVGKALKGKMCTYEHCGGIVKDHSESPGPVAATLSHELGHNFGMEHDYTDCKCPEDPCIMTPFSTGSTPSSWSSCSRNYLEDHMERGIAACLKNLRTAMLDEGKPFCGNGFVEEGEECDCGPKQYCKSYCCVSATCRLSTNCTCAQGECCDMEKCSLKPGAVVCRPPKSECDLPEYCTGATEFCPADVWKADGTKCRNGQAFCFKGECRTAADQCRKLWGKTGAVADDKCFETNIAGSTAGHCGHDRVHQRYSRCASYDVKCGLLHCTSQADKLALGTEGAAMISEQFISAGSTHISCKAAHIDFGLSVPDPGMVPSGAKCAEESMCYDFTCLPVAHLPTIPCPANCSGAGVCNNLGHCHCDDGYAPPNCSGSGYGGSVDSGPAPCTNSRGELNTAMLIVFLVVLPVALAAILSYFMCYRIRDWIRTKSVHPGGTRIMCFPAVAAAFSERRNRASREKATAPVERPHDKSTIYSSSKSLISATPNCEQEKSDREITHPLPHEPSRRIHGSAKQPMSKLSPNWSPPRSSALVGRKNLGHNSAPGCKPVRPAPRPPLATTPTESITRATGRVVSPQYPPGLSANRAADLTASSNSSPQRHRTLVAEMARRFDTPEKKNET